MFYMNICQYEDHPEQTHSLNTEMASNGTACDVVVMSSRYRVRVRVRV